MMQMGPLPQSPSAYACMCWAHARRFLQASQLSRLTLLLNTKTHSCPSCRAQVAESGEGYTLSGKPLDPTSSAARAYGLKPELLASPPTVPDSEGAAQPS